MSPAANTDVARSPPVAPSFAVVRRFSANSFDGGEIEGQEGCGRAPSLDVAKIVHEIYNIKRTMA
jgi:hypothetical protein